MLYSNKITFFERFEKDILSAKKTITVRDKHEKNYQIGSIVDVATFEDERQFCRIQIQSVTPIEFDALNSFHAEQENMSLDELKAVIQDIYPNEQELYVIAYQLVN